MNYQFRGGAELLWGIVVAVVVAGAQLLIDLHPETVTDWRFWAVTAAGALARAVGGAAVAWAVKAGFTSST